MDAVKTGLASATSTLLGGLKTQEDRTVQAADDMVQALAAAQNGLTGTESRTLAPMADDAAPGAMRAVMDRLAAGTDRAADRRDDGDILRPAVSLLDAKHAYAATTKALKVVGDIERDAVDRLGRRTRVEA